MASGIGELKRRVRHESEVGWRYLFNLGPTLSFRMQRQTLSDEQRRLVSDLRRDGIAVTDVNTLELGEEYGALQAAATRDLAAFDTSDGAGDEKEKDFLDTVLGSMPSLRPDSAYGAFALHPTIRRVANAYFGMYTQLRFYNVWRNRTTDAPPSASQLWHRDREDHLILKAFIYLSDVDDSAGPFRYARGSHRLGADRSDPDWTVEDGVRRAGDEAVTRVVPRNRWLDAIGPAGTVVLADTTGLHCGGLARDRERLLFTCLYTSRDSGVREWFTRDSLALDDPELAFATGAGRRGPAWVRK